MSTLLVVIQARRAELERQKAEAEEAAAIAQTASISDESRLYAIERLVSAAVAGSAPALERIQELQAAAATNDMANWLVNHVTARMQAAQVEMPVSASPVRTRRSRQHQCRPGLPIASARLLTGLWRPNR